MKEMRQKMTGGRNKWEKTRGGGEAEGNRRVEREARIRRSEINEVMTEMTGRRERKELNQVERVNP